jgi:hypothetical protein
MLHHVRAVHRRGNPQPMPVNGGRLGQAVGQAHLEHVANTCLDGRTRHLAVECPRTGRLARDELPVDLAGGEIHPDDGTVRERDGCVERPGIRRHRIGGGRVRNRSMTMAPVSMIGVAVMVVVVVVGVV